MTETTAYVVVLSLFIAVIWGIVTAAVMALKYTTWQGPLREVLRLSGIMLAVVAGIIATLILAHAPRDQILSSGADSDIVPFLPAPYIQK
jgi:uncharacterized membrane protein